MSANFIQSLSSVASTEENLPAVALIDAGCTLNTTNTGITGGNGYNPFTAHRGGATAYLCDVAGNLYSAPILNTTGSVQPTQLVTAAAITSVAGAGQITIMDILPDNSAIIAAHSSNKIIKILLTAPYTVTVLAGSGAASSNDGVGTAATFNSIAMLVVEPVLGNLVYLTEVNTGDMRELNLTTLATRVTSGTGFTNQNYQQFNMGSSGQTYLVNVTDVFVRFGASGAGGAPCIDAQGEFCCGVAVDDDRPSESYAYYIREGDVSLYRVGPLTTTGYPNGVLAPTAVYTFANNTTTLNHRNLILLYRPFGILAWCTDGLIYKFSA
jgi:hypothetical protein